MAFSESLKALVRRKAHFMCCLCKSLGVEIHHIEPQGEGGLDIEDNAAPLCPSCHETYGGNPQKRKFIREARDLWYEICESRYGPNSARLDAIETLLKNVEAHTRTSTFPLLPFSLFYTLRHTTTEDTISQYFNGISGYKSLKREFLQLTGSAKIGGATTYNYIEYQPAHSHCVLKGDALRQVANSFTGWGESIIKSPLAITVDFFIGKNSSAELPSLTLDKTIGDGRPHDVKSIELFDEIMFQDAFCVGWKVNNPTKQAWSIGDLEGTRLRIRFKFMSWDDVNIQNPPRFHNLHLYFGRQTPHILFFSCEQLECPVVMEAPEPLAKWDFSNIGMTAREMLIEYDLILDEALISNQLIQVA
jgi:hypothetical protein